MPVGSITIKELAQKGANIHITSNIGSITAKEVAKIIKSKGTHMTINADMFGSVTSKELATILGSQLTIIV